MWVALVDPYQQRGACRYPGAGPSETGFAPTRPHVDHRDRDRDVRIRHRSDRRSVAGSRYWGRGAHKGRMDENGLQRRQYVHTF